jgi:hypothetical protein
MIVVSPIIVTPPAEHLGQTIELLDNSLIGVAGLGMVYLSNLVADAQKLI